MILKGSQRAGAGDLAGHLLNAFDNEGVELAGLRGTVAEDLHGAFAEYEATALGTRCAEPLYSLSINPPVEIDRDQYFAAIERIERALDLQDQPRAVVFHVKNGREHCHVVWSRIYAEGEQLKAVHMGHDHSRLMDLSCAFFRELGVPLPDGLAMWEAKNPERFTRPGQDYSRAEKIQSEATGITVAERRSAITEAFRGSDSAEAFRAALEERGYTLARGDRRGFVVLDHNAEIFSLVRQIDGAKAKDVRAKLAALTGVPDVHKAKAILKERAQARVDAIRSEANSVVERKRLAIERRHRDRAISSFLERRIMERRHAEERLALKAKHKAEAEADSARRNTGARRLVESIPGLGAILRYYVEQAQLSLQERQRKETETLFRKQELRVREITRLDTINDRKAKREEKALAQWAMAKAMRKVEIANRRAVAEGRQHAMPDHQLDPKGRSTVEWYRQQMQNAADVTARKAAAPQRGDTVAPADDKDRQREMKRREKAEHYARTTDRDELRPIASSQSQPATRRFEFLQNALDVVRKAFNSSAPAETLGGVHGIGPIAHTAAAFMASLRADSPQPRPEAAKQRPTPAQPGAAPPDSRN